MILLLDKFCLINFILFEGLICSLLSNLFENDLQIANHLKRIGLHVRCSELILFTQTEISLQKTKAVYYQKNQINELNVKLKREENPF